MWEKIKELTKGVLRKVGLIKNINKLKDHKRINVEESEYNAIEFNKRLYGGYVSEWHDLRYEGTKNTIERRMKTLGMPKLLSKRMAKLVFNEGVSIALDEDSKQDKEWSLISDVFTSNKFIREFQRYLEYMFAMGGVAVEIYLDGDKPKLAFATADAFFPLSHDAEQVDEAVIANQFKQDGKYYTLLKWHEWLDDDTYRIKNELYESNSSDSIGDLVNLNKLYDDMEEETFFYGLEKPLFIYIKPNEANNKNITSPLGISMFANAYDTIEMLDTMYDFWYNEFRLGKRRVAVPEYLVKTNFTANGTPYVTFDDSEELFVAMNSGEMEEMKIKDLTVDLRVEQITHSIQSLLDILALQVGFSAGSFTFKEGGIKTATQVVSENSETYQTRSSHVLTIEDALRDIIEAVYYIVTLNQQAEPLERTDISISFEDGVFEDRASKLEYWSKARKEKLVPTVVAIQKAFGLSEKMAQEWADAIEGEGAGQVLRNQQAVAQAELEIER